MMEEPLLKSNFLGRDGFRWWIGQIANVDAWKSQADGEGWGSRYKVRIMGYHPYETSELADKDLPWAGVMLPATAGTGGARTSTNTKFKGGDVVVGFFLDGDEAQIPIIMGAFGRTQAVPHGKASGPFVPFTGFTGNIPKPEGTVDPGESTGQGKDDQKTPRSLSSKQAKQVGDIALDKSAGGVVTFADSCEDTFMTEVTGTLENLLNVVGESVDFMGDTQAAIKKIQTLSNGLVGTMFTSLYDGMIPILQEGLAKLYQTVFNQVLALTQNPVAAHLAGVAAQQAMVSPVSKFQDSMQCAASKIVNGLEDTIKGLVESTVLEVVNFGVCASEQFVGNLVNGILDDIDSGLESVLGGIGKILSPAFKVQDFLRGSSDVMNALGGFFDCGQSAGKCAGVKQWTIGYGPKNRGSINDALDNVLDFANINSAAGSSGFQKPDCGTPSECGPPTVTFFGGSGDGGFGKVLLGNFVNNTPDLRNITHSISRTASIIGVEITDPGSGYNYAPPLVSFNDPCNSGFGAVGRAIVDYETGKITGVYLISPGEYYPTDVEAENHAVDEVHVVYSGVGYSPEDTGIDDNGMEYTLTVDAGKIIAASPINKNKQTTILPTITINSSTGSGALLVPLIGQLSTDQGEVEKIIDCVT